MGIGKLEGKVAVITGATSGIGEGIAYRFAGEGAKVVLTGRRKEIGLNNINHIRENGGQGIFAQMDVTKVDQVKQVIETTMSSFGRIDILVNNAGVLLNKRFKESTVDDWYNVMRVDGLGYLLTMWEVLPIMVDQGSGCVINVSSLAATRPSDQEAFYCFTKAGMNHVTRALNLDYAPYGIRINTLSPGLTLTEMTQNEPRFYELAESVPIRRHGTVEDMAGVAAWLASDDAAYVAGANIAVDGGIVA